MFPQTEISDLKKKELLKTDLIGLTPKEYILYRINRASSQNIAESSLSFDIDSIILVEAGPGENADFVAVVKITPGKDTKWTGELEYRIPQVNVNRVYGDFFEITLDQLKTFENYNALAKAHYLPPRVFNRSEFVSLEGDVLTYRLVFNNSFFVGSVRVVVAGVNNLISDLPIVEALFGVFTETVS